MGGETTEITDATRDVLLEAAHFEPTSVGDTSRRHRLGSEASRRFERGVDDALPRAAAELAVTILVELGAAQRTHRSTDLDDRPMVPPIELDPTHPGRVAGIEYPYETVVSRLGDIGCVVRERAGAFDVTPPSWRPDLRIAVDLVQEVIRLEGYANLPSTLPRATAGTGLTQVQRLRRLVGRTLAAAGYIEVLCSPFVDAASAERLQLDGGDGRIPTVRIANPVF